MKTSTKMLFYLMMVTSTMMVLSSNSWISMWVGLEINLMSFVPLMSKPKDTFMSQNIMKYFLVQSMASMIFIMVTIIYMTNKYLVSESMMKNMIMLSMMMKLGMPPFHMWFPEVLNKMEWKNCLLLMTWQKIAPLSIMSVMMDLNKIATVAICLSSMMGAIGGLNQTSTQKIMAYSSINHMSWLVVCTSMNKKSWMLYMLMYSIMMLTISLLFYNHNINFINQMNMSPKSKMEMITIVMMMLSMGGVPPFLGFIPKWVTIQYMIESKEILMMVVMVMSSLLTLSYYLRMTSSLSLMMSDSQKWMNNSYQSSLLLNFMLVTNMMLPMVIFLMNFY